MKTSIQHRLTFICILFILSIAISCKMSEHIVDDKAGFNGSFESEKNGVPINWITYTSKTAKYANFRLYFDTKEAKDGKQCLRFDVKNCSDKGGRLSPGIAQEILVKEGETYRLTYWVKNKESNFRVVAKAVNANNEQFCYSLTSGETINEWTEKTAICAIGKSMTKLRIEVNILSPGAFWIDDIKVERLPTQ